MYNLAEEFKIVGAKAPIDATSAAWVGKPINMANYSQVTFLMYVGAVDGTGTVTVENGTSTSLGTAMAFNYQIASTGAAAYSVLDGALTAATTAGFSLSATGDNKIIAITINNTELPQANSYVGVKVSASGSANLVTLVALCRARYMMGLPLPDPTT